MISIFSVLFQIKMILFVIYLELSLWLKQFNFWYLYTRVQNNCALLAMIKLEYYARVTDFSFNALCWIFGVITIFDNRNNSSI